MLEEHHHLGQHEPCVTHMPVGMIVRVPTIHEGEHRRMNRPIGMAAGPQNLVLWAQLWKT